MSVRSSAAYSVQSSSDPVTSLLLGLLGIVLSGVTAQVGVTCSPITVVGVSGTSWYVQCVQYLETYAHYLGIVLRTPFAARTTASVRLDSNTPYSFCACPDFASLSPDGVVAIGCTRST